MGWATPTVAEGDAFDHVLPQTWRPEHVPKIVGFGFSMHAVQRCYYLDIGWRQAEHTDDLY